LIGNADCEDMRFTRIALVMLFDIDGISEEVCMPAIPRICRFHDLFAVNFMLHDVFQALSLGRLPRLCSMQKTPKIFSEVIETSPKIVPQPETPPISHEQLIAEAKGTYTGNSSQI
jgi:hypothetical protein